MPRRCTVSTPLLRALSDVTGLAGPEAPPSVCRAVAELSRLFTRGRLSKRTPYLADSRCRLAYLSYYVPVNLAKVQALLDELPADTGTSVSSGRLLALLDLGSGPGTAGLGVLDWVRQHPTLGRHPVDVLVVDQSEPALKDAERVWEAYVRSVPANSIRRPVGPTI